MTKKEIKQKLDLMMLIIMTNALDYDRDKFCPASIVKHQVDKCVGIAFAAFALEAITSDEFDVITDCLLHSTLGDKKGR